MGWVAQSELRRRNSMVLDACVQRLREKPLAEVTIASIVEASGLPPWAAYGAVKRLAKDRDHLIRRAVLQLVDGICEAVARAPAAGAGVLQTIEASVAHMAGIVRSPEFAAFFRLLVREGAYLPWLSEDYERVLGAFSASLEQAVQAAGRQSEAAIFFRPGAVRTILRRLEVALALPALLPGGSDSAAPEELVAQIAREAFAQTYAWHLDEAA